MFWKDKSLLMTNIWERAYIYCIYNICKIIPKILPWNVISLNAILCALVQHRKLLLFHIMDIKSDGPEHLHSLFSFFSSAFLQGIVRIHLLEAENLAAKDSYIKGVLAGKSDPYALLRVGTQMFTSRHVDNNLHPQWREMYEVWEGVKDYISVLSSVSKVRCFSIFLFVLIVFMNRKGYVFFVVVLFIVVVFSGKCYREFRQNFVCH